MKKTVITAFAALVLSSVAPAASEDLYVATNGSDDAAGTAATTA